MITKFVHYGLTIEIEMEDQQYQGPSIQINK